jgi:glucosamine-6-phosphate deaminase
MQVVVESSKEAMGQRAAQCVADRINQAIKARGAANIILATGASQFEMLAALITMDVDWSKVTAFHLDEYVGMPVSHPASFRKYLKERFHDKVAGLKTFHYIEAETGAQGECARLNEIIARHPIDVACVGIGENGHLAFNDPPADFETEKPYIIVNLTEDCRRQQLGEGWFGKLEDVPQKAVSMSIRQIMKSACIVCAAPDARKAPAVKMTLEGEIGNMAPASIMREHGDCHLFLDKPAAALLSGDFSQ